MASTAINSSLNRSDGRPESLPIWVSDRDGLLEASHPDLSAWWTLAVLKCASGSVFLFNRSDGRPEFPPISVSDLQKVVRDGFRLPHANHPSLSPAFRCAYLDPSTITSSSDGISSVPSQPDLSACRTLAVFKRASGSVLLFNGSDGRPEFPPIWFSDLETVVRDGFRLPQANHPSLSPAFRCAYLDPSTIASSSNGIPSEPSQPGLSACRALAVFKCASGSVLLFNGSDGRPESPPNLVSDQETVVRDGSRTYLDPSALARGGAHSSSLVPMRNHRSSDGSVDVALNIGSGGAPSSNPNDSPPQGSSFTEDPMFVVTVQGAFSLVALKTSKGSSPSKDVALFILVFVFVLGFLFALGGKLFRSSTMTGIGWAAAVLGFLMTMASLLIFDED